MLPELSPICVARECGSLKSIASLHVERTLSRKLNTAKSCKCSKKCGQVRVGWLRLVLFGEQVFINSET